MKVAKTELPGVLLIEPDRFGDDRGFFQETWHARRYEDAGIRDEFVQDNISLSRHGVLRGMHFQNPHGQAKLVYILQGEVFDVAVDVRAGSPDFGKWTGATLSADNGRQLYIPAGFAHGFCVTGETALFAYKCTDFYDRESELTIRWDDPQIGVAWPISHPTISEKDAVAPFLSAMDRALLPHYEDGR
ncbi:MAG: dTDP-4-dehydrorhamnose 3,5-epimerase [Alphaproteobacteria bacterium]|nr:dTDP-4-dehydrorhamnose 3,5-epimerase [Alphaproteobacteria bacterium]